jgi:hypothetical protein
VSALADIVSLLKKIAEAMPEESKSHGGDVVL